jgi:SAM-dependent methyltransferase
MGLNELTEANRERWDELTHVHARSAFYDVAGFKAGRLTLTAIEREELGDVSGRSLLHLQCHFGLDTLSWARLGARVTGVDFSKDAIALARSLSEELGIQARFICADVYDLPDVLSDRFDVVFTSFGVLAWLPDLPRWAAVIAHFLRPGGTFYMAEIHPFAMVFDDEEGVTDLRVAYPYFHLPEPTRFEVENTYADPEAKLTHTVAYEWSHSLADVVNALIGAGLCIEFLHEFPWSTYQTFPFLQRGVDGLWRLAEQQPPIPLTFSLRASK